MPVPARTRPQLLTAAVLATALASLAASSVGALADEPDPSAGPVQVVHLVVDSLHPDEVGPDTPTLMALRARGTWYEQARSVMASETLPNHVAMATGTYPGRNGIPGNGGRAEPGDPAPSDPDLGRPELLQATSLTAAIEAACPELRTVTAFSKGYVFRVFAPDGADADLTQRELEVPGSGHIPDAVVGSWVVEQLAERAADHVFVNLGDVDRSGHVDPTGVSGVTAGGRRAVLQQTDAVVASVVEALRRDGSWDRTVLFITSDHSMDHRGTSPVELQGVDVQGALDSDPRTADRLFTSENGGAALVYLRDPAATDAAAVLAAAREVVLGLDGVDEALYRLPNDHDPGADLGTVHPDWHLAGTHRAGELFVTVRSGHVVGTDPLPGNHGHAITRHITALVTGGWDGVVRGRSIAPSGPVDQADDTAALPEQAEQVDWAPTAGWLLGVPDPGGATPQWQGRVLTEAFVDATPPTPACVDADRGIAPAGPPASPPGRPGERGASAVRAGALPATGGGAGVAGLLLAVGAAAGRRRG